MWKINTLKRKKLKNVLQMCELYLNVLLNKGWRYCVNKWNGVEWNEQQSVEQKLKE